ncbi:hypothetical protein [Nocardioides sp. R-C-SC26]|uniref:hypothetical protein n=1 Tax=Nocardioides sp. R-C-SC26 TaxID=2870414 RepID=UPI001E4A082A|nr:hypothetical protein [Nocardioides sp. R-C-SC26]
MSAHVTGLVIGLVVVAASAVVGVSLGRLRRTDVVEGPGFDPTLATADDIRGMLLDHGVDAERSRVLVELAELQQVTPLTMWLWATTHGLGSLELVLAAEVQGSRLLHHLANATAIDPAELELFARLNGLYGESTPSSIAR